MALSIVIAKQSFYLLAGVLTIAAAAVVTIVILISSHSRPEDR